MADGASAIDPGRERVYRSVSTPSDPHAHAYAAPVADDRDARGVEVLDDLVERTRPTSLVIAAALVVALTGTLFALSAAQLWMNFTLYGIFRAVAWAMLGLGLVHFAVATKIFRLRLWAAQAAFALAIVSTLGAAAWFLLSTTSGLFTLYALFLPLATAASAVLSFLSIAPARAATEARFRLDRDGLQTDF